MDPRDSSNLKKYIMLAKRSLSGMTLFNPKLWVDPITPKLLTNGLLKGDVPRPYSIIFICETSSSPSANTSVRSLVVSGDM